MKWVPLTKPANLPWPWMLSYNSDQTKLGSQPSIDQSISKKSRAHRSGFLLVYSISN